MEDGEGGAVRMRDGGGEKKKKRQVCPRKSRSSAITTNRLYLA